MPVMAALAAALLVFTSACTKADETKTAPPSPNVKTKAGTGKYAWTQFGPGSTVLVRSVAKGGCPDAHVDGATVKSEVFAHPTQNFPMTTCQAEIAPTAKSVTIDGVAVPPPPKQLEKVIVVGDIGCYMQGKDFQACLDPSQFPAAALARQIEAAKPDLVVFVGDIYYSQTECPPEKAAECGGVPTGDNWESWAYDFFDPYSPALSAAPWIFTRGNHESCDTKNDNGGPGWFQVLAPANIPCSNNTDPYRVDIAGQSFIVFDSAIADDNPAKASQVPDYAENFKKVHELAAGHPNTWFVDHRPLWAAAESKKGPYALNQTLQDAIKSSGNTLPADVSLILSGHMHSLAYYTFADGRPAQIVSGGGSAILDKHTGDFAQQTIDGVTFAGAEITAQFGYVQLHRIDDRANWQLEFVTKGGSVWKQCRLAGSKLDCA